MSNFDMVTLQGQSQEQIVTQVQYYCSAWFCSNLAEYTATISTDTTTVRFPMYSCSQHREEILRVVESIVPQVDHSTVNDILDIRDSIIGGG